jgi:hypothetical protein
MVIGNLQWIRGILLRRMRENAWVTAIALRRVFRLFWAYWVLLTAVGAGMFVALGGPNWMRATLGVGVLAAVSVYFLSNWVRRVVMAFVTGLQIPQYWKEIDRKQGVLWS